MRVDRAEHFSKLYDFTNLYRAHCVARRSKRSKLETATFEANLGSNLSALARAIQNGTYELSGYYKFDVYEPKKRDIHALHYKDRVVQHCLCDEILEPVLEPRLIYDNAACRKGRGTAFCYQRITKFLCDFYKHHGNKGYFLRCDIKHFFDSVDHEILKRKLAKVFADRKLVSFLYDIIDSYETTPCQGIPMGNQTSQWFAIYYLDELDRVIKEKLGIKYYVRYMDDMLIIGPSKEKLRENLAFLPSYLASNLHLSFNAKTQIFPIKNGVDFLGFHFYLSDTGCVTRRVMLRTKRNFRRRMKKWTQAFKQGDISFDKIKESYNSIIAHLNQGHTQRLARHISAQFCFTKGTTTKYN